MPAIAAHFHVLKNYAQQLITIYIVGYAFGQLIYSPFANRYGRKTAIYLGIGLYLLSCLICLSGIHSNHLNLIIIGRLFMALGSAVGFVMSFTIINDFYPPQHARPIVSYLVLAFAIMPAIAVAIGGFITTHFSWQECFYFLFFYGIFIAMVSVFLPETLPQRDHNALRLNQLVKTYAQAFSHSPLVVFSMIYGLLAAFIYIIATAGPFIGIKRLGMDPSLYGLLMLIPYSGQAIGALLAAQLNKYFSSYSIVFISFCSVAMGAVLLLICVACHCLNNFTFIMSLFFVMAGLPIGYSSTSVMALANYNDKATGSAILSFIAMGMAMLTTFTLTALPDQNPFTMPLLFLAILIINLILFCYAKARFVQI